MSPFRRLALVIVLMLGLGAGFWGLWPSVGERFARLLIPEEVETISTAELAAVLVGDRPPLLLDVRAPEEFEVSHIPGAMNFPPGSPVTDVIRNAQAVVVYCSVGVRSGFEAVRLAPESERVYNLDGAVFRWAREGRPLVNRSGPTGRVHPYDALWGRLLPPELRATRP